MPASAAYRSTLVTVYVIVWLLLAIAPAQRGHWAAENLFVVTFALGLWLIRDRVVFSRFSATAMFAFLCLHAVGAHYGYARVPYDAWIEFLTGTSLSEALGLTRNHYDRLAHLAFGLLLAWPIREFLVQTSPVRGRWSYLLPVGLVMAASMAYEVAEWLAVALVAEPGAGPELLGMQGDPWDAQKDMALAAAGAMVAMSVAVNRAARRERQRMPARGTAAASEEAASA